MEVPSFAFQGRTATSPLRTAMGILVALGGNWRKSLPVDVPLGHVETRWNRHVVAKGKIDRTYWELATYFAVSTALASGDLWVPTSRVHRSLDELLTQHPSAEQKPSVALPFVVHKSADDWLAERSMQLDAALLETAKGGGVKLKRNTADY